MSGADDLYRATDVWTSRAQGQWRAGDAERRRVSRGSSAWDQGGRSTGPAAAVGGSWLPVRQSGQVACGAVVLPGPVNGASSESYHRRRPDQVEQMDLLSSVWC
jgi:hypothetical protein